MSKDEVINAFLGAETVYEGKLSFKGSVHIEGTFTGQISSEGTLIVGKDALITGEVRVGELKLTGRIVGDIYASKLAIVNKGGYIEGVVNTPILKVDEGGRIQGQINMQGPNEAVKK